MEQGLGGDEEEEGLGKNWLGEDIGPLIGDTMLVEFEVGLVEPLLDPRVYPSISTSVTTVTSSAASNSDWYGGMGSGSGTGVGVGGGMGGEIDDSAYGNERGRRGLGPSESNMMPFLSVVALSPRDYSLGSAHQALVARHLVAGEPAPKPLVNLSVTSSGQHTLFSPLPLYPFTSSPSPPFLPPPFSFPHPRFFDFFKFPLSFCENPILT